MKRFASIIMALVLVFSLCVTGVYAAEEDQRGKNWYVHFTQDNDMDESFPDSGTKMADELSTLQPGDSATFYIELRNDNSTTTDWYMTNRVIQSLEKTRNAASKGAYSYILAYEGPNGRSELFNSDTVGGTQNVNRTGREGLEQATQSLDDYFYLDTLDRGESGNVILTVRLEGETQGNGYQDTLAELAMQFAVELHRTTPGRNDITWRAVRTGDETNLLLWSAVMLGCGVAALALGVYTLRRNRKYKEENEDE